MDKEQLRKQLESCKKGFMDSKYSDCHKALQKIVKDCGDSKLTSSAKLKLNSLVVELHKNKFYSLESLSQLVNSVKKAAKNGNGTSFSLLGIDVFDDNSCVFNYNCSLFLFYSQQHENAKNLLAKVLSKSTDSYSNVEDVCLNWAKIMDCAKWDTVLKYNITILWCEVCIKLWESGLSDSIERDTSQVLSWLEAKIMEEKASASSKDSKSLVEKWVHRLSILKNNVLLTEASLKSCKKEMRSLTPANSTYISQAVPGIFIRAKYEYLRKNYIKSMKMLQIQHYKSHSETGESIPMMFYNNLACISHQNGKHELGVHYSRKAFAELEKIEQQAAKGGKKITSNNNGNGTNASTSHLHTVSAMRFYELHYNMGTHLLAANRPEKAFDSFFSAVQMYYHSPKLWLKLAECCIAAHTSKLRPTWSCMTSHERDPVGLEREEVSLTSFGSGTNHKLVVKVVGDSLETCQEDVQSAAFPAATLGFGSMCVENTLLLVKNLSFSNSGNSISNGDLKSLKLHSLTCGAYINLCIGDYLKTINYCDQAMSMMEQIEAKQHEMKHIILLYKAEALVHIDQTAKALDYLALQSNQDAFMIKKSSVENEVSDAESYASIDKWVAYMLSMASIFALKGSYDECKKRIQMVALNLTQLQKPLPTECYMLATYIELCHGNHALAVEIVKRKQIPSYENLSFSSTKTSTTFVGAT